MDAFTAGVRIEENMKQIDPVYGRKEYFEKNFFRSYTGFFMQLEEFPII